MNRSVLITALVVVVLAAAGTWFYFNFELRDQRIHIGYDKKARSNPYLAAEYFLARTGTRVYEVPSLLTLQSLPPTDDTLFLNTPRTTLDARLRQRLLDWVHAGGQLVVVSWTLAETPDSTGKGKPGTSAEHDALLDPLGVRQYMNEPDEDDDKDCAQASTRDAGAPPTQKTSPDSPGPKSGAKPAKTTSEPAAEPISGTSPAPGTDSSTSSGAQKNPPPCQPPAVVRVGSSTGEKLKVYFNPRFYLEDENDAASARVGDEAGLHLLHYRLGDGGITVLSDDDFMRNPTIGQGDNAAFLWHIAHWSRDDNAVWVVLSDDMPALPAWLLAHAQPALIALALLLVAWLWQAMRRFGPPQPAAQPVRRSLREHLLASGRFLWQHGHQARLLEDCRLALRRRIEAVQPGWVTLTPAVLAERLAALTGLPVEDIKTALSQPARRNEHEFTRLVDTLETLRKML